MPNKNKAQEWLQTTVLAMGSVALATTSVAMIYLTSLAHQGKGALARLDTAVDQLMGNAPHTEGSAVAELGPTLRALADVLREVHDRELIDRFSTVLGDVHDEELAARLTMLVDQLNGSYVMIPRQDVEFIITGLNDVKAHYDRLDASGKAAVQRNVFQSHRSRGIEDLPTFTDRMMSGIFNFASVLQNYLRLNCGVFAISNITRGLVEALRTFEANSSEGGSYTVGSYSSDLRRVLDSAAPLAAFMVVTTDGRPPRLHNLVNTVPDTVRNVQTGWFGNLLRWIGVLPQ